MKLKLVNDLLVDSWTIHTIPFGNVNHQQRHVPRSTFESQHRLFGLRLTISWLIYIDSDPGRGCMITWLLAKILSCGALVDRRYWVLMETRVYIRMGGPFIWRASWGGLG